MNLNLPIGYDNFGKIINAKLNFVDKSLFIKELLDDKTAEIALITRPRRFGKTLNLSMLQHFLAAEVNGQTTKGLFDNLKITKVAQGEYLKQQGRYPVIFISLKDLKDSNFETAYNKIKALLSDIYDEHNYLKTSDKLSDKQKKLYHLILNGGANEAQLQGSLRTLAECLYTHHGEKPWLLIDEYDTPIQASFQNNYYEQMVSFIRNFFGAALKGNPYVEKAVITGILRVAKESLFSGLNNIKVYSLLHPKYSQYFGFTEEEVNDLLQRSELTGQTEKIKKWYNGYQFGETVLYNPWSIVNCLSENGNLRPYWINTSDNALIKHLFAMADKPTKIKLESLVRNESIEAMIDEYVTFLDFEINPGAIWSLLLASGYLKAISCEPERSQLKCVLLPPNYEVGLVYQTLVTEWFSDKIGYDQYDYFIGSLLKGNIDDFTKMLQKFLIETFSVFDAKGDNPEKFYHGFVLGLISSTMQTHNVKSNRESGYGRYDVMITPKDSMQLNALGLILEFKIADENEDLKESAKEALQQVEKRNYEAEVRQLGINNIIKIGLAFFGKKVEVVYESSLSK